MYKTTLIFILALLLSSMAVARPLSKGISKLENAIVLSESTPGGGSEALAPITPTFRTELLTDLKYVGTYLILASVVLLLLLVFSYLICRVRRAGSNTQLSKWLNSACMRKAGMVASVLLSIMMVVSTWVVLKDIRSRIQEDLREALQGVLKNTHDALCYWVEKQEVVITRFATDPRLVSIVESQLAEYQQTGSIEGTSGLDELRKYFDERERLFGKIGFFIITPDGTNIGSMRDNNLGITNLIKIECPDLFARVLAGEALFIPPIPSDVPIAGVKSIGESHLPPTMFFAAPIQDKDGNTVAVLTQRFNPTEEFTSIAQRGRIATTGETYFFDEQGRMLSASRFENQLVQIGLMPERAQSILSIRIQDPGRNLLEAESQTTIQETWPLTVMAQDATSGQEGFNMTGYRDYRGVKVLGVWTWDDQLGLGLTTEIDAVEAYATFYRICTMVGALLATTLILGLSTMVFIRYLGKKNAQILRQANEQLEERVKERTLSLQKITSAVEQSPVSVVITDQEGRIEYANPTFSCVTGYSAEEVIGQNPRILKSGKQSQTFYEDLWQTILAGKTWKGDFQNRRKDGSEYWERAAIAPVANETGQISHFVGVKEDVTEQKRMETELLRAKQTAESANKSKSVFLANMSHEIRTPLNAILGFSEILDEQVQDQTQKGFLDSIRSSGKTLLSLINDILDLSRVEAGRMQFLYEPIRMATLLDDLESMFKQRIQSKGLDLSFKLEPQVPDVVVIDENRVKQILINLIGNAVKFTETGTITVWVNAEGNSQDEATVDLTLRVVDSGRGIRADQIQHMFEAFRQQEGQSQSTYGGTGLGLAIVKNLVEQMNGSVSATSEEGQGSTFSVELRQVPIGSLDRLNVSSAISGKGAVQFQEATVLVVDDNESNRSIARHFLGSFPELKIVEAQDGIEALDLIPGLNHGSSCWIFVCPEWTVGKS